MDILFTQTLPKATRSILQACRRAGASQWQQCCGSQGGNAVLGHYPLIYQEAEIKRLGSSSGAARSLFLDKPFISAICTA